MDTNKHSTTDWKRDDHTGHVHHDCHNHDLEHGHHDCHDHGHGHHGHHHHHHHDINADRLTRSFKLGIGLNLLYVVIEAIFGFFAESMGLLSDAGHNLSDVASLVIAMLAIYAMKKKPNDRFTYGYRKSTVLASVVNAIILYVAVIMILIESIEKLLHPVDVDGMMVAWVAGVGILVNGFTAWLFMKDSRHDLNVKGAYLHMLADTLVSVGVVIAGIVIGFTGWYVVDPIIGIIIAILIAVTSWSLLSESLRMAFDGVPSNIDVNRIRQTIENAEHVESYHHLHIWVLSTTEVAMTVHVVVKDPTKIDGAIVAVRNAVKPLGIGHATIEAETTESAGCESEGCRLCQ